MFMMTYTQMDCTYFCYMYMTISIFNLFIFHYVVHFKITFIGAFHLMVGVSKTKD